MQAAIDAANIGDTVWVEASGFAIVESLSVTHDLKLRGAAVAGPGIAACSQAPSGVTAQIVAPVDLWGLIVVNATYVRVYDMTFSEASPDLFYCPIPGPTCIEGGNVAIENSEVEFHHSFIRNGGATMGGGIGIDGGTLRLFDTQVFGNRANFGGGIWAVDSTVEVHSGSRIGVTGPNRAWGPYAGGIGLEGSTLTVFDGGRIGKGRPDAGNVLYGGCIAALDGSTGNPSTVILGEDAIVSDCEAVLGGGIYARGSDIFMESNASIADSNAEEDGGLIYATGGSTVNLVEDASLLRGVAERGGLAYLETSDFEVTTATFGGPFEALLAEGQAENGGGIFAYKDAEVRLVGSVLIKDNTATDDGGGIYLLEASLDMEELAHIGDEVNTDYNRAKRGAGVFAVDSELTIGDLAAFGQGWEVPVIPGDISFGGIRISGNNATHSGAGIELHGSTLAAAWLVLANNRSVGAPGAGDGGGLALFDESIATLKNSILHDNRARRRGGAAYVENSELIIEGVESLDDQLINCDALGTADRYCSEIRNNQAGRLNVVTLGLGGGIFSGVGGSVELQHTALVGNGSHVHGPNLYVASGGDAYLNNSLMADIDLDWSATDGVYVSGGGSLESRASTFGGDGATVDVQTGANSIFQSNIFWPDGGVGAGVIPNAASTGACNVGLGVGALPGGNLALDPDFTSTSRGYYRLSSTSPAADYCGPPNAFDMDYCERPFNLVIDAGAFERDPFCLL